MKRRLRHEKLIIRACRTAPPRFLLESCFVSYEGSVAAGLQTTHLSIRSHFFPVDLKAYTNKFKKEDHTINLKMDSDGGYGSEGSYPLGDIDFDYTGLVLPFGDLHLQDTPHTDVAKVEENIDTMIATFGRNGQDLRSASDGSSKSIGTWFSSSPPDHDLSIEQAYQHLTGTTVTRASAPLELMDETQEARKKKKLLPRLKRDRSKSESRKPSKLESMLSEPTSSLKGQQLSCGATTTSAQTQGSRGSRGSEGSQGTRNSSASSIGSLKQFLPSTKRPKRGNLLPPTSKESESGNISPTRATPTGKPKTKSLSNCSASTTATVSTSASNDSSEAPAQKKTDEKRVRRKEPVKKEYVTYTELDVLMGRGGQTNHHPGNIAYRKHVLKRQKEYKKLENNEKTKMSREVLKWVKMRGGRFLAPERIVAEDGSPSISYYVATVEAAREKISQVRSTKPKSKWCFPQRHIILTHASGVA